MSYFGICPEKTGTVVLEFLSIYFTLLAQTFPILHIDFLSKWIFFLMVSI